jgi:hypothetical protein
VNPRKKNAHGLGFLLQYQSEQVFYDGHVSPTEITGRAIAKYVSLSCVIENWVGATIGL